MWFIPPPLEEAAWDIPAPHASVHPVLDPDAWVKAEARQGPALVRAAEGFARLDERLRHLDGIADRLAQDEAEALVRLSGGRMPVGGVALFEAGRAMAGDDGSAAMLSAQWAFRRLRAGRVPDALDLPDFLGRTLSDAGGLGDMAQRPEGAEFAALADEWAHLTGRVGAHPITRAASAFHIWTVLGLSGPEDRTEAGCLAALIGAGQGRGGLPFLPAAMAAQPPHRTGGTVEDRLAAWLRAVAGACEAGLLLANRLAAWMDRASAETSDLSGRTPPALIAALAAAPLVSASSVERSTGVSRDAAERNLGLFAERGLVREVTGQKRFRLWRAAV